MDQPFKSGVARVRRYAKAICEVGDFPLFVAMLEASETQTGRMEFGWVGPEDRIQGKVGSSGAPFSASAKIMSLLALEPKWGKEVLTPDVSHLEQLVPLVPAGGVKYRDFGVGVSGLKDDELNKLFALLFLRLMYRPQLVLKQLELWAPTAERYEQLRASHRQRFSGRYWEEETNGVQMSHIYTWNLDRHHAIGISDRLDPVWVRSPNAIQNHVGLALHFASGWPGDELRYTVGLMGCPLPDQPDPSSFKEIHWVDGQDGVVGLRVDFEREFEHLKHQTAKD